MASKASRLPKSGIAGKGIAEKAYENALVTLRKCCDKHGLFASGGKHGYKGVWSRDSFVAFMGASLVEDERNRGKDQGNDRELFRITFEKSLGIISRYQSSKGQIPNAVHSFDRRRQLLSRKRVWNIAGKRKQEDFCEYRLFFPVELQYLLKEHGFQVVGMFDNKELRDTDLSGPRLYTAAFQE